MGTHEQEPVIPPSFEVILEAARADAKNMHSGQTAEEHGLRYILQKVKDGLADATRSLMGHDNAGNIRDYLPENDEDHRYVMEFIAHIQRQCDTDPSRERIGWEEIWLPSAVEGQGNRVTRAQAERLFAIMAFRRARSQSAENEVER